LPHPGVTTHEEEDDDICTPQRRRLKEKEIDGDEREMEIGATLVLSLLSPFFLFGYLSDRSRGHIYGVNTEKTISRDGKTKSNRTMLNEGKVARIVAPRGNRQAASPCETY
jgi:hypothetical protein